ncbi:MAG: PEGA domain-containing protein [Deltaproteobacteria bacterium]|nr:PEGA domain-containing protein [Deltaproteobacteria bacterium]
MLLLAAALAAEPAPTSPGAPPPSTQLGVATGDVYVGSTPAGARILVDGNDVGLLTPNLVRGLAAGKHTIRVEGNCADASSEIDVQPGLIARAEMPLVPASARLELSSTPAGATLLVDGVERGAAPLGVDVPACVVHTVVARAPGHAEATQSLTPAAHSVVPVALVLAPERFGTLVLDVAPIDARVSLDGKSLAAGPQTLEKVPAGAHQLLVEARSYRPHRATVDVPPDQLTRLSIALESNAPARKLALRIGLDSAVTASALAAGSVAAMWHLENTAAFDAYLAAEDDNEAAAIFRDEVEPGQVRALAAAGAAVALAGVSTVLWVTTDFSPAGQATPVVNVGATW